MIVLRVKELRQAAGLSQEGLAERAGVRQATISRLENAQAVSVSFAVLERLGDALGVDPALLLVRIGKGKRR